MSENDFHRRATDDTVEHQAEIEKMIAQESDQKSRITLLVLSRMNALLIENTKSTQNVVEEVEKLASKVEQIVLEQNSFKHQRKGAVFILTKVAPILQLIMVGAVGFVVNDLRNLHNADMQIIAEQARREPIIADLRDFKKRMEAEMDKSEKRK